MILFMYTGNENNLFWNTIKGEIILAITSNHMPARQIKNLKVYNTVWSYETEMTVLFLKILKVFIIEWSYKSKK